MAWTQTDVERLEAAIAENQGVRSLTFSDGQTITFQSTDEQLKLLATMRAQVAAAAGTPRMRFAVTNKGV